MPIDERKKRTKHREKSKKLGPRSLIDNQSVHPYSIGSDGQLILIRPSDGALVSLKCCVEDCEKSAFETMQGLRNHVTRVHGMKDLFENKTQAIERCGVLVVEAERSSGVKSFKSGISATVLEERNTEADTSRSLGYRVKPYSSKVAAIQGQGLLERVQSALEVRRHPSLEAIERSLNSSGLFIGI